MNRNQVVNIAIICIFLVLMIIEYSLGIIRFSLQELSEVKIEFDFISYVLGIIATVIGSTTVAFFADRIRTNSLKKRTTNSLFSEIKHNHILLKSLLGENDDYIAKTWAYDKMPFSKANFENAKQSGFLYTLEPNSYEKISRAYDIIRLIEKESYSPKGTASNTFEKLDEILNDIHNDMETQ